MKIKLILSVLFCFTAFFVAATLINIQVSACNCHCNYNGGYACGGTWGCDFTTAEQDEMLQYAKNNPGTAYTGQCTYRYTAGWNNCVYSYMTEPVNSYDGCRCPYGDSNSCGFAGACSVCSNPVYRWDYSCNVTPTTPPVTTPPDTTPPVTTPPVTTPPVGSGACRQDGGSWCSNAGGPVMTIDHNITTWAECQTWCNANMSTGSPVCQYNGAGGSPNNYCWIKNAPGGDINNCIWDSSGAPPWGSCFTGVVITTPPPVSWNVVCCDGIAYGTSTGDGFANETDWKNSKCNVAPHGGWGSCSAPSCNDSFNMDYNIDGCNNATFKLSGFASTNKLSSFTNTVTGVDVCNSFSGSSCTGILGLGDNYTWEARWKDCETRFGKEFCTDCGPKTKSGSTQIVKVSCGSLNGIIPNYEWGDTVNFSLQIPKKSSETVRNVNPVLDPTSILNCTTTATDDPTEKKLNLACNPANPPGDFPPDGSSYTCKTTWIQSVTACDATAHPIKVDCSGTTNTAAVGAPAGFLQTLGGDAYIGANGSDDKLTQTRFPIVTPAPADPISFTYYSLSFANVGDSQLRTRPTSYKCTAANDYCSKKLYLITNNYQDETVPSLYRAQTWYSYALAAAQGNANLQNMTGSKTFPNDFSASPAHSIFSIDGDLKINAGSVCNSDYLFIVSDKLDIYPDFKVGPGKAGCAFFVKGATTIHTTSRQYDTSLPESRRPDIVEAFIVSNGITTETRRTANNDNQLLIKGGLILSHGSFDPANSITLKRNINRINQLFPTTPSEVVSYDGARYLELFGSLLAAPKQMNIREVGSH